MTKIGHGRINGRTIELNEDLGLSPGAEVEVQVKPVANGTNGGEGLKRCAGALANDPEWDEIMEEVHGDRKRERRIWDNR